MTIYLDNAATTPLDNEVFNSMTPYLFENYGNPSAQHAHGRRAKVAIEACRATIALSLNALPEEIIFTSGGTEADNMAIVSAVESGRIDHVITTKFEHQAVLQTLANLQKKHDTRVSFIKYDDKGNLDLQHLEYLLRTNTRNLVSVMHANNEIGNLNDIEKISELCERYQALFHTDTVQTMGHYHFDLQKLRIDFLTASAHKFHGPKGIGFLYRRQGTQLAKLLHGGGQERNLRAGTENIPGIVGLSKAIEIAYRNLDEDARYITHLKYTLIDRLRELIPEVQFNGNSAIESKSLYTILSVKLPAILPGRSLLEYLDERRISVSGGSACCAGGESHVLKALSIEPGYDTIRFSFSKFNNEREIDYVAAKLADLFEPVLV